MLFQHISGNLKPAASAGRVPGRHQRIWISPIVRTKYGVALADPLEMGETAEGRFASLF